MMWLQYLHVRKNFQLQVEIEKSVPTKLWILLISFSYSLQKTVCWYLQKRRRYVILEKRLLKKAT